MVDESTKELSKTIRAIEKSEVHKICSGQVIISLAAAVKELVENGIDAGATLVEVKLKNQGLDSVEVSDNGCGVIESNFQGLTAKYHTSKLRQYNDLEYVETFGFRGEALNSLCALSNMTVITRHTTAEYGTQLELDSNGVVLKKSLHARDCGTTVILRNLFTTLPVRRKKFEKDVKSEFTKMCQLLKAYCLVTKGVRIICTNNTDKGLKQTLLQTFGSKTILDNITTIFGAKQTTDLLELQPIVQANETPFETYAKNVALLNTSLDFNAETLDKLDFDKIKFDGWISSCAHGCGRSARDRQFFYVNSRPCEPKSIIKTVNDFYHKYNSNQSPFVFLNLNIQQSDVDVNLTPDKRQILFNDESLILLALKLSLLNTFKNVLSVFKMNNPISATIQTKLNVEVTRKVPDYEKEANDDHDKLMSKIRFAFSQEEEHISDSEKGIKRKNNLETTSSRNPKRSCNISFQEAFGCKISNNGNDTLDTIQDESDVQNKSNSSFFQNETVPDNSASQDNSIPDSRVKYKTSSSFSSFMNGSISTSSQSNKRSSSKNDVNKEINFHEDKEKTITCKVNTDQINTLIPETIKSFKTLVPKIKSPLTAAKNVYETNPQKYNELSENSNSDESVVESSNPCLQLDADDPNSSQFTPKQTKSLKITISDIRRLSLKEAEHRVNNEKNKLKDHVKFHAEIAPNKNKAAETELQKEIHRDTFSKMQIVGQFNLGFIVVKLNDDIFIIDQHATDEKYNFEMLQKTTVLQNQKLVVPQNIELNAINESILMDNLRIFEMNGFHFVIDEKGDAMKRIKLVAKPLSQQWEFGKEDIDELLFMLQDAPNTMCRPSRVRSMFASRACRKSVMIGTALTHREMRKLVDHMGDIEQPWNCPHGRPTMRHLVNLRMLQTNRPVE